MPLYNALRRLGLGGRSRGAQVPPVAPWPAPTQPLRGPLIVDEQTIEALPVAGRCIELIASLVSGLPIYGREKEQPPPRLLAETRQAEAEWPTRLTLDATIRALLTYGNAYWYIIERYADGKPYTISQLNPAWTSVTRSTNDGMLEYWYAAEKFDNEQVIHFRASGYPGYGAASAQIHTLTRLWQIATSEAQIAKEWATRGGQPIGYLTAPTSQLSQTELTRQAEAFDDYWSSRTPQVPVFAAGVDFKPISLSSREMELIANRQWSATEICTAYGVPPHLVGVPAVQSSTTYSSALMDMSAFVQLTLARWVGVLESVLRPELGKFSFDLDSLLRANRKERYQSHEIALRNGWMTINEVREIEDLPPLPEPEPEPEPMMPEFMMPENMNGQSAPKDADSDNMVASMNGSR